MIKRLHWDSKFFGFPVGLIHLDDEPDWKIFIPVFKQNASDFKLIYFITGEKNLVPDQVLKNFNGRFINQRVLYSKQLRQTDFNIPEYIFEYKETNAQRDFIDLAYLSGYYSRFKIDTNFQTGKFKELYKTWIRRSLERSIADKVFVASHIGKITAMVTCKFYDSLCKIGLVAVSESEQGKGTGRYLMQMTEEHAFKQGLTKIQVPTQSNNIIACRFYEKQGFSPISITNYYHFWIK